jgi:hypothetical protein
LDDIRFLLQVRKDIHHSIADEQRLRVSRHVQDEDVTDSPRSAQTGVLADHFRQELVGMKTALHQGIGTAGVYDLDGLLR